MRALQLKSVAGPEALELVEIPEPDRPEEGVVIDVQAAGLSFADLLFTRGEYQIRPDLPFVPGTEVAGVVRSAPPNSRLKPGHGSAHRRCWAPAPRSQSHTKAWSSRFPTK